YDAMSLEDALIKHVMVTPEQVTYLADMFLDKNKNYMAAEHQDLLIASKYSFVAGLFPLPHRSLQNLQNSLELDLVS
ncbi:hypothetical protein S83_028610, partial [Arachis hypogaea]